MLVVGLQECDVTASEVIWKQLETANCGNQPWWPARGEWLFDPDCSHASQKQYSVSVPLSCLLCVACAVGLV